MTEFLTFKEQLRLIDQCVCNLDRHLIDVERQYGKQHFKAKFIARPLTILTENLLSLKSSADTIGDPSWWAGLGFDDAQRDYHIGSHYIQIKFTFFVMFFSSIESQFRSLYSHLYPGSLQAYTKSFHDLYNDVLAHFGLNHYLPVYDLSRLIRNLIHNAGIHTSRSQVITYKGNQYQFTQGHEALVLSPQLQFAIYDDLCESIVSIKDSAAFGLIPD